jgi:UDP-glucose 4-epimerase
MVGFQGDVQFKPEREGDIRHSVADISLAQQLLGYRVVTDFAQGLQQTIQHFSS